LTRAEGVGVRGGNTGSPLGLGLWSGEGVSISSGLGALPFDGGRGGEDLLGECPGERLLAADLLAADEGLDGYGDGAVDVLGGAVLGQTHLAEGFGDTHDGFQVADLVVVSMMGGREFCDEVRTVMG
jgi:hypothetical protein